MCSSVIDAADMETVQGSEHPKSGESSPSAARALWPMDLKLTHLDWNPEATLIHFQGQYLTICELDYKILHREMQHAKKTISALDIGEFCLVEDLSSAHWYRGRVQRRSEDLFDVFLIDHGNVLSVDINHISSCSKDLFILPPKIVCGFLSNVVLLQGCSHSVVEDYFSSLIGRNVTGYIQAILPYEVLLLEASDINRDLVRHGFGRHLDIDTFLFLVEILTEVPLKQNVVSVPDLLTEKPRGQEFSFKPSGLQRYQEILSFFGPRLSCGTHVKVQVTAAVSPGLFYCQKADAETDLRELSNKLAAVCEHKTKECSQKAETENLGLLCSVKAKDGKWYRGFVQLLPVNSQVRVLFIDYGFFESVKIENVYRLPPDFYSAPVMVFPCSLSCLIGHDEASRTQQLGFLKAALLGAVLDVEIKGFDEEQHLYSISVIGVEDNYVKEREHIQGQPKMKVGSSFETEEMSTQGGYLYHEKIISKAFGKTLEAEELQADSAFVGYVVYVQNPNHFWIRTQKRDAEFEDMMAKIADHFSQVKLDEDVLLNPELGATCCAVYEDDMHFYRGVVTDTLDHGAEVLFVDFGNIEKVPHMLIKKIPEEFASKSPFAFCCSLINVFPLDEVWTCAVSEFFRRAVSNKDLLVRVVHKRKNKFVVDLCDMGSDNSQSITELLISSKQAEYWNTLTESKVLKDTDVSKNTQFPRCKVTADVKRNPEHWETEENTCKKETETSQKASFKAFSIKPGCEFAVRCSYIKSPSEFWCQPLEKVPALEELMDRLQQYYTCHTVPLQPGDSSCVAMSPVDRKWHRAFITEKQKGHARVMLIDSGITVQISEDSLQGMMPEYVCLEGQAFRCSLCNLIEPADVKNCGEWSSEACKSLKDFVLDAAGGLRCKVVSQLNVKNKGLCNVVDLYNTQTQQSITDVLLQLGLARETTVSTKQLSSVSPEAFVYSSFDVRPGNEEQVYVTHVSSQWEVFCQLEKNTEIIEKLENKISDEIENMKQDTTRAVVRKLCLAKYFDGNWYRGLAHPVKSPLHLSVFFVDYGNSNILEKTQVMFIPRDSADLLYTPMQAVRCSLASVSKIELYAYVKEWLDGTILNKQVRAVILGKNEDGSFDVELFDQDVNVNEQVKELLLSLLPKSKTVLSEDEPALLKMGDDLNSAFFRDPLENTTSLTISDLVLAEFEEDSALYRSVVKDYDGSSRLIVEFIDYGNSASVGKGKIYSIPNDYLSQPRFGLLCSLLDTSAYENDASFTDAVMDKPLMVDFVRQHGTRWEVRIEILDVCLPAENEAAVEESSANDKEEEPPASSADIEEKVTFCAYSYEKTEVCKNETDETKSKRVMPAVESNRNVLKPTPGTLSTKLMSLDTFYIRLAKTTDMLAALEGHIADNLNKCEIAAKDNVKQGLKCLAEVVLCKINSEGEKTLKVWGQMSESVLDKEVKLVFVHYSEAENLWKVELVINELLLVHQIPTLPEHNQEIILLPSESQYGATEGEYQATSPPQHIDFAPVDMNKSYFGFAAAVATPFEFCGVLEDLLPIMNKVSIMLDKLPRLMPPLPEAHLVPGTCCLFKSKSENKWCRAEIMKADATLVLNLVDYGYCECLPREDRATLKRLPQELTKLPKVTYPCILRGVRPVGVDEQWSDEAAVFFQQALYQRDLQFFFREFVSNTHWRVDVLADGVHVAKELVDAGHANYLDIMLGLRFQVQNPQKVPLQNMNSDEDFGEEDEGSDGNSDLSAVEAEDKMLLSATPRSTQCRLM
ncbi:hypothetical protein Q5P01_004679 [Channa striata]|uniref:Tudor domain-containing protein n=1 Tax=Channa striata TaxID=64152 RepID=A0AA88NBM6_CHASR|nr:hypothetical protein Q5P01_004679 [Channa striata]